MSLIEGALVKADPEDAADLHARAKAYREELAAADKEARTQLSAIPPARRKVLTSHDALGYMGRAYGIQFLAPVGISTDAEPSARDVARLIQQIKTEHIGAYFIENSNEPRLVEQIGRESGAVSGGAGGAAVRQNATGAGGHVCHRPQYSRCQGVVCGAVVPARQRNRLVAVEETDAALLGVAGDGKRTQDHADVRRDHYAAGR